MNDSQTVLLAVGALLALLFFSKSQAVKQLKFVIRGADITFPSLLTPNIALTIGVQNPTSSSFLVNSIIGVLYLNGQAIANVNAFNPTTIIPGAETPFIINIDPNVISTANELLNILQGKTSYSATVELVGSVNAESVNFPLDISYQIS